MCKSKELTKKLGLLPHPEVGFYKEIFRSPDIVIAPERFETNDRKRSASTIIYFLMLSGNFSVFHRIKSDETWLFVEGSPILIHMLHPETQNYSVMKLGELRAGANPIITVPFGTWFAAEVEDDDDSYSLVSCFVSPGFEFEDFELAKREKLIEEYPKHKDTITRVTRQIAIQQKNDSPLNDANSSIFILKF